jgi:pimeloyl-ACP methyl ester carboxylesterase
LGSFIWDEIKPMINYPVLMIDFPNRKGGDKVNLKLNINDYSDLIIEKIKNWNKEKIVVITHSIGGLVGLKVAEYFGNRIVGFIGIGSAIPANGGSFVSCLPFPKNILMSLLLRIVGTKPPKSAIIKSLCNDITSEQTEQIVENFTPEATSLYVDKSNSKIPNTKTLYVKLSKDNAFPISSQDKMVQNLNAQQINILDSGHLPMLSVPEQLSEILNKFVDAC